MVIMVVKEIGLVEVMVESGRETYLLGGLLGPFGCDLGVRHCVEM